MNTKTGTTTRRNVSIGKARAAFMARHLDIDCPEILHERPTFSVPLNPTEPGEWLI